MEKNKFSPTKALLTLGVIFSACAGLISPTAFAEQTTSSSSTGTVIAIPPDTGGLTNAAVNTTAYPDIEYKFCVNYDAEDFYPVRLDEVCNSGYQELKDDDGTLVTFLSHQYKVCTNHYTEKSYYVGANEACASGYQDAETSDGLYVFEIPGFDMFGMGYTVCLNNSPAEILEGNVSVGIHEVMKGFYGCESFDANSYEIFEAEEAFYNNFTDCLLSTYNLEHDTEVKYDLSEEQLADIKDVVCYNEIFYVHSLEEMTNLEELYLGNVQNESLDFSHNAKLTEVSIESALNLKNVNVTQNLGLEHLYISDSEIEKIDISKNTELGSFSVKYSNLSDIDVSKNTKLTDLDVSGNNLSKIDVSMLPELELLFVGENNLEELDVSKNKKLTRLWGYDNKLTNISTDGNSELRAIYLRNNNFEYIDLSQGSEDFYADLSGNKNLKIVAVPKSWEGKYTEDKIRERLGLDENQKGVIIQYGPLKAPNTGAAAIFETAKYAAIVALPAILILAVISKRVIKRQSKKVRFSH